MKEGWCTTVDLDGTKTEGPWIWCDLCGWGDTIIGNADDTIHFCRRHKADEVREWWLGFTAGYFEEQVQIVLL